MPSNSRTCRSSVLWTLLPVLWGTPLHADPPHAASRPAPETVQRAPEYALRAAYLHNFTLFVEWPAEAANGTLPICVLGTDLFGRALPDALRGRKVGGRELRSAIVATRQELAPCKVVYVSEADEVRHRNLLDSLRGSPVLTVGESEGFIGAGGIVRLFVDGEKLRFQVNPEAARRSGLMISARLLELAQPLPRRLEGGP